MALLQCWNEWVRLHIGFSYLLIAKFIQLCTFHS
jgi:hypothetical protein